MLRAAEKISDLIFSPGRPPQVQVYGQMVPVQVAGFTMLTPDDTRHIAADLIGDNKQAITTFGSTVLATSPSDCRAWPASGSIFLSNAAVAPWSCA
jgi:hypothetical protein